MTITRATEEHRDQTVLLFRAAIHYAASGDGFDPETTEWVADGVERAERLFDEYLENQDGNTGFLVALLDDQVVGTVGRTSPSTIIRTALSELPIGTPEMVALFVDPSHHRQGIGRAMHRAMVDGLRASRVDLYVLDCGYRSSQGFWRRLLGEPTHELVGYWGEGFDHLIWVRRTGLHPS